ncbi:Aste57867_18268 [Aphanomyces stellatus]|uniref:Aste57867_18268 protein n=1 Tax=Aphanomyces stellatus TaxID=120398 RepID=A0A485LDD4_9STRA|nr:hypothetical protein As57867_018206 [Aphanomyces stellatus]VFT95005.1 Aste57867_18268 [Aphanomyces stellatus]
MEVAAPATRPLVPRPALCEGEHHYLSTELEVAILRAFLTWTEGRIQSSYALLKSLNIPFLPFLLSTTESVAARIGVHQWFNALVQLSDPWTSSIDNFVGRRLLNTIAFILQSAGHVRVVQTDGSASYAPTIEELEAELARLQQKLEMEKQEKDELQDTVRRVLAMVSNENQGLHALLNHVAELEAAAADGGDAISASRIKELEEELEDMRRVAAMVSKENDDLRKEILDTSRDTTSSTELEDEMERLQTLVEQGLTTRLSEDMPPMALPEPEMEEPATSKGEDELERLQALVARMNKEKESLQQELIDIQTFRESTAGQQMHEMESLLAETNIQKTMLEAENKKLRVALKKKGKSQSVVVPKSAETWDAVKA